MSSLYILNETKAPIKVQDLIEWAKWYETADRRVALDKVHGYRVSTVFLGIDHSFGEDHVPLIFETMVFAEDVETDWSGELMYRYRTWDEAAEGHKMVVSAIKEHYEVRKNRV